MRRRLFTLYLPLAGAALLQACADPAVVALMAPGPAPRDRLWFVFLESGRPTPADRDAVAAMQRGHIDNFKRLFAQGRLLTAGPMRDPAGRKRGMVTVRAASLDELRGYFMLDEYVREGYLNLNAVPATANKALNTEGIDASRVEEVRIVLIGRDGTPANVAIQAARRSTLQDLVARGTVGAWYTLEQGTVAEVLFARTTDTAALQSALSAYPGLGQDGATLSVWGQWLSPGVVV